MLNNDTSTRFQLKAEGNLEEDAPPRRFSLLFECHKKLQKTIANACVRYMNVGTFFRERLKHYFTYESIDEPYLTEVQRSRCLTRISRKLLRANGYPKVLSQRCTLQEDFRSLLCQHQAVGDINKIRNCRVFLQNDVIYTYLNKASTKKAQVNI